MPRLSTSTQTGQPQAYRVELTEVLAPGGSAEAYVLHHRAAHSEREGTDAAEDTEKKLRPPISGGTVTVYDRWDTTEQGEVGWGANYLLPGERVWVRHSANTQTYDVVGSNGLLRKAVADEAIADGETGTVSVWNSGDTGENVTAKVNWGTASVALGDEIWITYSQPEASWIVFSVGSGCYHARFQVTSADPTTYTGIGEILARPPGCGSLPGSRLEDTVIDLCDPFGCHFNRPNEELTGAMGFAVYMVPGVDSICDSGTGTGSTGTGSTGTGTAYAARWEVVWLCCPTPDCDALS